MDMQICKVCNKNKPLLDFSIGKNKKNGDEKIYHYKTCKLCDKKRVLLKSYTYKKKNRKKLADKQIEYHKLNKENDSLTKKEWYQINKDNVKLRVKNNIYAKRKNDILFKLKEKISARVRDCIIKNRKSVIKYLPYSLEDLRIHLESLFEPWMTWENHGIYKIDLWDDNDQSTWTWQIDHIIAHSKFKYITMEDQEFKNCWSLSNLRPYSAKQNIIDGARL